MKMFVTFAIVILTTTLSFNSNATLVQLLNELESKLNESNWGDYNNKMHQVQAAIVELPDNLQSDHNRRLELLEIRRMLKQCKFYQVYCAIDRAISSYFPYMHTPDGNNPHDKDKKDRLATEIQKPDEYNHYWSEADLWVFIELVTDLAEYYFYNDELVLAENLLDEARKNIFGTEPAEGSENFHPEQRTLEIRILKLMGDVNFYRDNFGEAEIWYLEALSFFDNYQGASESRGSVYLGLTQSFIRQGKTLEAYTYFQRALADSMQSSTLAKAYADLTALQYASILRPSLGYEEKKSLLNEIPQICGEHGDCFSQALCLLCRADLLQNQHGVDNQDDIENLQVFAANIAQKNNIPLLARLVKGEPYQAPAEPTPDLADEEEYFHNDPLVDDNATQTQITVNTPQTPQMAQDDGDA